MRKNTGHKIVAAGGFFAFHIAHIATGDIANKDLFGVGY